MTQKASLSLLIETQAWKEQGFVPATLCRSCLRATQETSDLRAASRLAGQEISVLLADDARLLALNKTYRGKDTPTNVLSFPADTHASGLLGDIALGFETCVKEANQQGKTLENHLCHLLVHGILHLMGFDHQTGTEAKTMEQLESKIMLHMHRDDPWAMQNKKGKDEQA